MTGFKLNFKRKITTLKSNNSYMKNKAKRKKDSLEKNNLRFKGKSRKNNGKIINYK